MKSFINNIKADRWVFRGFNISLFLTFLTILFILFNYRNLPPLIPIFNQLPWGTQRLTEAYGIFIPVAVFGIIFVINIIFASFVYSKNPLIARIVSAITFIIAILNFLFIIRTILVIL
ncbi:MAG: hypothetical protein AAB702_01605 [Patescibacteria group bacterium]